MKDTEETYILSRIQNFIDEHGALPTTRQYGCGRFDLPSRYSLEKRYGSIKEFHQKYFKQYTRRHMLRMTDDKAIECFKNTYISIGQCSQDDYDRLRPVNTPCSRTIMKCAKVDKWIELLDKYFPNRYEDKYKLTCRINFSNSSNEERLKVIDNLNRILNND